MKTKKFNTTFWKKKITMDCYDLDKARADTKDCLSDITGIISNIIGVKFRDSSENINY